MQQSKWLFGVATVFLMGIYSYAEDAKIANLIPNSSFELGSAGFELEKTLSPAINSEQIYEGGKIDAGSSVNGKQSLCIPNRFADIISLTGCELALKPATKYTMSVWLKSNVSNYRVKIFWRAGIRPDGRRLLLATFAKGFSVGKQWKRYTYSFTTSSKGHKYYHLKIESRSSGKLWLDGLQLVQGGNSPYSAKTQVEAAFNSAKSLYVMENNHKKITLSGAVVNNTNRPLSARITVNVINDYDHSVSYTKKFTELLKAKECKKIIFGIPPQKYGAYTIKTTVGYGDTSSLQNGTEGNFAVIGKYDASKTIDLKNTFCVSFMVNKTADIKRKGNGKPYFELLSMAGCRLLREWATCAFAWSSVAPTPEKKVFTYADTMVDNAARYGISIMPVLGGTFFRKEDLPEWIMKRSKIKLNATPGFASSGKKVYLPPIGLWKEYINAVARRYKDKIIYYEIMNEPNIGGGDGYLAPAEYMEYLKSAYQILKNVSAQNQVVGFCATGDQGGRLFYLLEGCFKLGGLNYADIVSFHPYDARSLVSKTPADKQIKGIKKLITKYVKDKKYPLWNTELVYLNDTNSNATTAQIFKPHRAAWRFLTDLGEGLGQSTCISSQRIFKRTLMKKFNGCGSYINTGFVPSENFVLYNALARFFEGAKPFKKIHWGKDAICYVYERNGKYLAAFWKYRGRQSALSLPFIKNDMELFDLFGNRLPKDSQTLLLNKIPYYLKWKHGKPDAFVAGLKRAELTNDPMVVDAVKLLNGRAAAFLRNNTKNKIDGSITLISDLKKMSESFSLLPGTIQPVWIKLPLRDNQKLTAELAIKQKKWTVNGRLNVNLVECYLVPKNNKGGNAVPIALKNKVLHKLNLKAEFKCGYDNANLYLYFDIKDGSPSKFSAKYHPWTMDCIELFIDAKPTAPFEFYNDYTARGFINPYAPTGKWLSVRTPKELKNFTAKNVKSQVKTNADGYHVELTIPLSALNLSSPYSGKIIGLDIAVTDVSRHGKLQGKLYWSSKDGNAHRSRNGFGYIILK